VHSFVETEEYKSIRLTKNERIQQHMYQFLVYYNGLWGRGWVDIFTLI
jgi:hypothetical protein